jgi:thioredoxin reductase (NADPH)
MEARFCENVPVTIVGGGNAAGQAAIFVCERTSRATLIVREPSLTEYMSRYLADRIERDPRIEVMLHSEVRELLGDEVLEAVVVEDNETGERTEVPAKALFVFIGFEPHAEWVEGALELAEDGSIPTGSAVADWALPLETSRRGVFAAGDVRRGAVQRVAAAVGEGAMAVRLTHQRLDEALRH